MYIISYDISNDKIRGKIAKELLNYGRRVQYSVFECYISEKQYKYLYEKLVILMQNVKEGNIRIYNLCAKCERKMESIGIDNGKLMLEEEDIFII
ncbi:MAG: CRISPR-associated endonuclease Cas2 [Lachnospiraceae bacterium]